MSNFVSVIPEVFVKVIEEVVSRQVEYVPPVIVM